MSRQSTPRSAGAGPGPGPPGDEKARRVRSLLSSYYGSPDGPPAEEHADRDSAASSEPAPATPPRLLARPSAGLDSATFDPDRRASTACTSPSHISTAWI